MNLNSIQSTIKDLEIDALYITKNGMFLNMDVLWEENSIYKLTNFSGSFAKLIITSDKAFLFVDSRYSIQARKEVDTSKITIVDHIDIIKWLNENVQRYNEFVLGFNPKTTSISEVIKIKNSISNLEAVESDIVDIVFSSSDKGVFELDTDFSGIDRSLKVNMVADFIKSQNLAGYIFTNVDSVSWLLNLRSNYISSHPAVRGFAIVALSGDITLFCDDDFLDEVEGVNLKRISELPDEFAKLSGLSLGYSDKFSPYYIQSLASTYDVILQQKPDICEELKCQKNPTELEGFVAAHIRDGVALTKFLFWLENNWEGKTELDVVNKLYDFRIEQDNFFANSFDTIAGFGENGAIVHYRPSEKTNKTITSGNFLLLDSGAHYFDGTTDVTRTISIGDVPQQFKDDYTLVLKSHISLANSIFPLQTSGIALDALARSVMWQNGTDYQHGTGHGVGHFLNVHEGPQSLSTKVAYPIKEDMVLSIEPGYYKEGSHGVRIENLYYTSFTSKQYEERMLKFVPLTLVPIDIKSINISKLSHKEITWLNNYHSLVFETLSPYLSSSEQVWLNGFIIK